MRAGRGIVSVVCVLILFCAVGTAFPQPPSVPSLVDRHLDQASYADLARQWNEYIARNGESADALVNLGMAYDYSEEAEAALNAARRAVELDPDNPKALVFLGKMLSTYKAEEEAALEVLQHCSDVAPDYGPGVTMLAAVRLRRGELRKADEAFTRIFERRIISRPLQDYAYNMLVGLPAGAVLITNGDNDTFPPLSLQAGMNFRTDVAIINLSLLNLPAYVEAVFARRPSIRPDYDVEKHQTTMVNGEPTLLSYALVDAMISEGKAPVYIAATAAYRNYGFNPDDRIEGINLRAGKKGISPEDSARLFLESYRLDSATDWGFAWSLVPTVAKLVENYVASMIKLAAESGVSPKTKDRLLDRAASIADFHGMDRASMVIATMRKK